MKQSVVFLQLATTLVLSSEVVPDGESVEGEIQDLVEMVPFEKVMALGIEYAISDPEVKHFLYYLTSQQFKENVAGLQASPQFRMAAGFAEKYQVDLYSFANRINHALDMPPIKRIRNRRSPGDGILAFVDEVVEMTPLSDMKQVYEYKVDNNPRFKDFMEHLLSSEALAVMRSVCASEPVQTIKKDLVQMGIPVEDLVKKLTEKMLIVFQPKLEMQE